MIEDFWRQKHNKQTESWVAHNNINAVMLATSLMPNGFLSPSDPAFGTAATES